MRRHSFDLVAARSGNVKRIEWRGSTPKDKTHTWFREYVRERNRLLGELSAITGRVLGITTAIHGEPVMFHILNGNGRTVRRG